jgi:DNA-binding PadR family transcriptional regulator
MAPNNDARISATEEQILRLLIGSIKELYGLEMVKRSEGKLKRGTIYVTLQRMEQKGLVESREEDDTADHIGLRRRLYKPTGLGERVLRAQEIARNVIAGLPLPEGFPS